MVFYFAVRWWLTSPSQLSLSFHPRRNGPDVGFDVQPSRINAVVGPAFAQQLPPFGWQLPAEPLQHWGRIPDQRKRIYASRGHGILHTVGKSNEEGQRRCIWVSSLSLSLSSSISLSSLSLLSLSLSSMPFFLSKTSSHLFKTTMLRTLRC